MKNIEIVLRGVSLKFIRENDIYTDEFYQLVADDVWEPMTIAFFERTMGKETLLLDIGAATGVLSMFASKLGSRVVAYEPNPVVVDILQKNIEMNDLNSRISVIPDAVSDMDSVMKFSAGSNSSVLSPVVMHGMENQKHQDIRVRNIIYAVDSCLKKREEEIVIKMDIEGAEYRILCNTYVVSELAKRISKLFVSFHPGFNRPTHFRNRYLRYVLSRIKYTAVIRDHYRIFKNLNLHGKVSTCDGKVVSRASEFAGLLHFGSHDWIWEPTR
jgi:FkbM family methyltransferase